MKQTHDKMPRTASQGSMLALVVLAAGLVAGCASPLRTPAPVEDRSGSRSQPAVVATGEAPRVLPGAENAGKPGYYTVRPGDTLIRIALDSGQNWRDVVRWNNLDNPNVIEVGQVLRIAPPPGSVPGAPVAAAAPAAGPQAGAGVPSSDGVVTRPVASASVAAAPVAPGAPSAPAAAAASAPQTGASAPAAVAAASAPASAASAARAAVTPAVPSASSLPPVPAADDDIAWAWPTAPGATVITGFDEVKNKGLGIAGKAGDAVLAAADGRVVYAGAGLRGYGNLIILKHNNTYLTAYAHNQALLVKEDQAVRRGQKIAEMGATDTDRVKLHFEIRRQGKPVDPARFLPAR